MVKEKTVKDSIEFMNSIKELCTIYSLGNEDVLKEATSILKGIRIGAEVAMHCPS